MMVLLECARIVRQSAHGAHVAIAFPFGEGGSTRSGETDEAAHEGGEHALSLCMLFAQTRARIVR